MIFITNIVLYITVGRGGGEKKTVTSLYRSTEKDFVQLPRDIARKLFLNDISWNKPICQTKKLKMAVTLIIICVNVASDRSWHTRT